MIFSSLNIQGQFETGKASQLVFVEIILTKVTAFETGSVLMETFHSIFPLASPALKSSTFKFNIN